MCERPSTLVSKRSSGGQHMSHEPVHIRSRSWGKSRTKSDSTRLHFCCKNYNPRLNGAVMFIGDIHIHVHLAPVARFVPILNKRFQHPAKERNFWTNSVFSRACYNLAKRKPTVRIPCRLRPVQVDWSERSSEHALFAHSLAHRSSFIGVWWPRRPEEWRRFTSSTSISISKSGRSVRHLPTDGALHLLLLHGTVRFFVCVFQRSSCSQRVFSSSHPITRSFSWGWCSVSVRPFDDWRQFNTKYKREQ